MSLEAEISNLASYPRRKLPLIVSAKAKKDLTFKVADAASAFSGSGERKVIEHILWREDETHLYVPRRYPVEGNWTFRDKTVEGAEAKFKFTGKLIQEAAKDQPAAVAALVATHGGILAASPGKGKTVIALKAAADVGRRTLVIAPTTQLLDQWIDRAVQHTNLKREDIGIVQGEKCEWNRPLIIGMVQSLSQQTYPDGFYKSVGNVISDEVHRMGAPTWLEVISQFAARVRWGLSATVERSDGMHKAFMYHVGPIVYHMLELTNHPELWVIHTSFNLSDNQYKNVWNGEVNIGKMQTSLSLMEGRNVMLVRLIKKAYDSGRKILGLSRRIEQMNRICDKLRAAGVPQADMGVILGKTKQGVRDEILKKRRIILASEQIAGMGLDQPDLDTLIWLTPSQNVTQNVGRIERECPGKRPPLAVDLVDRNDILRAMGGKRRRIYEQRGYQVKVVNKTV